MKKKVFVSYDHSEDVHYKELLRAWNANPNFDFEFDQRSPNTPIDSLNASTVKAVLTTKMKESSYMLVIVGAKSHTSKWMRWEIQRALEKDVNLKLAFVKIKPEYKLPIDIAVPANSIASSFDLVGIQTALSNAVNRIAY